MNPELAEDLLRAVVGRAADDDFPDQLGVLRSLATYKYNDYQQYTPGRQFIESLALWLRQFENDHERRIALRFVQHRLIYISDAEMRHFVSLMARDRVPAVLQRDVAQQLCLSPYKAATIRNTPSFRRAVRASLFLGMSDGSRIDQFRRNTSQFTNEQFSMSYELSDSRARSLQAELKKDLDDDNAVFEHIFLVDDFAGSGTTILRTGQNASFEGRLVRFIEETLPKLLNGARPKLFIMLYLATSQALEHLRCQIHRLDNSLWSGTTKPEVIAVMELDDNARIRHERQDHEYETDSLFDNLLHKYYDSSVEDEHKGNILHGFSDCGLPLILPHNTPNNSVYLLWEAENTQPLFPRFERHQVRPNYDE